MSLKYFVISLTNIIMFSSQESEEESEEEFEENFSSDEEDGNVEIPIKTVSDLKSSDELTFVCEALCDFTGEEPGDLSFSQNEMLTILSMREDGWWEAENEEKIKGMVPSTFLKVSDRIKKYLNGIQESTLIKKKDSPTVKLHASSKQSLQPEETLTNLANFPFGFCNSSLSELLYQDSRYSAEAVLTPTLSDSGLNFKDLHYSSHTKSLMPVVSNLQRVVRLVAFRQIILPGIDFDVKSRYVRVCLHNGAKVLSNIHTVKAKWDSKAPKIWTFNQKITLNDSCLEEGQLFIRSNVSSATTGILFQLCVSFVKISTGDIGEMSCGWVFARLLDDSGLPVPNRTKVLHVHVGVPFANQSLVHYSEKIGPLKHFIGKNKHPRMVVTITTPRSSFSQKLNFLPITFIGPISSVPLLMIYRKILIDKLLKDRISLDCTELVQSPFLSTFAFAYCQSDILDILRISWNEKQKREKQSLIKDERKLKLAFERHYTETAFLILQSCMLPLFDISNPEIMQERRTIIDMMMKKIQENGPMALALSSEIRLQPIAIQQIAFDITGIQPFNK